METTTTRVIHTEPRITTIKISLSAIYIALGVVLSYFNPFKDIVIFGAKINPFAHMINAIAGVTLGPVYAILIAIVIATIRFSLGWGTILAFPGGITGAIVVSIAAKLLKDKFKVYAAFTEPIGTVFIGGTISAFLINTSVLSMWFIFFLSSIVGAVIGYLLIIALAKQPEIRNLVFGSSE